MNQLIAAALSTAFAGAVQTQPAPAATPAAPAQAPAASGKAPAKPVAKKTAKKKAAEPKRATQMKSDEKKS